jgi:hypothetical protein
MRDISPFDHAHCRAWGQLRALSAIQALGNGAPS